MSESRDDIMKLIKINAEGNIFEREGKWYYRVRVHLQGPDDALEMEHGGYAKAETALLKLSTDFGSRANQLLKELGE